MLDYKTIITQRYALHMSGRQIADTLGVSKSGVNDFLKAFETCETLSYPLPKGITNYGIYSQVYGKTDPVCADSGFVMPDYSSVDKELTGRKNMTLIFLWGRYKNQCIADEAKFYSYRQFCSRYADWIQSHSESLHLNAVAGEKLEVDFAGKTFEVIDSLTGEALTIVVFVSVLPYSQYIYAEGMLSTKESDWICVNNHMLEFFGGVTPLVVCDNCKQAVTANKDWIEPELNKDYAEWAEHNGTVIMPAKVRRPRYKSSVENSVGILEKGFFHELEDLQFFSIEDFNRELWIRLDRLNRRTLAGKDYSRHDRWLEEKNTLLPLPSVQYQYTERKEAKVSSDFHVRFDNAYYSVPYKYAHKSVLIMATTGTVTITSRSGEVLCEWPRAHSKGLWQTNPDHLPAGYKGTLEWNGPYFRQKAAAVGPYTSRVIEGALSSRKYEVQTYRQCVGILGYAKKYNKKTLEECCRQAVESGRVSYTFIRNSIPGVAAETMDTADTARINEEKNQGAFLRSAEASNLNRLLARSRNLMKQEGGCTDDNR